MEQPDLVADPAAGERPADPPSQPSNPSPSGPAIDLRPPPPPRSGGLLTLLRFMRTNNMLSPGYARMLARLALLKLRHRGRLRTDGLCFICPGVQLELGRRATLDIGRWAWIGHDTKIRVHEGEVRIGAKTVIGQECTISAFQHVAIGRECIVADRVMLIDFDHGVVEVERPIRLQGIYKRDVDVAHNVWIGYGACILRGVAVGENSVIGTNAVVTGDVPANAVVGGVPARVIRMREAPREMRWARPVEPDPAAESTLEIQGSLA
jgi:acetyltransferase-like isoleucine patch superfamily enzyme